MNKCQPRNSFFFLLKNLKIIFAISFLFFSFVAHAQNDELAFDDIKSASDAAAAEIPSSDEINNTGTKTNDGYITVENESPGAIAVERMYDASLPYKLRRTENGILFSINSEKFYPLDYVSQFKDGYIEDFLGKDRINLLSLEIGYKRNFSLGSAAILFGYANGKKMGSLAGIDRQLEVTRTSLSLNYAVDNIFNEPWIVPYAQGGIHSFDVLESSTPPSGYVSKKATTGLSLNYRFGMLFQLNWIEKAIDPTTQSEGLRSSGLENTFIDLYVMDHTSLGDHYDINTVGDAGKPNLTSGFELGIGLKLEF